jgi:YVTN family beta-propeller protein
MPWLAPPAAEIGSGGTAPHENAGKGERAMRVRRVPHLLAGHRGGAGPLGVAVDPDTHTAFVANGNGTVSVIDEATGTATATIANRGGQAPAGRPLHGRR